MDGFTIILIILLIMAMAAIGLLYMGIIKKNESLKNLKSTSQKVVSLNVLQDFIEILGNISTDSKEKMNEINNALIERYEIKYSTIVMFDGEKFAVEASNVNEKQYPMFESLESKEIFAESIRNATPKYVTVNQGEKLPYLEMEFERAKSAIFFPIYTENIYMGYWLIEGNKPHEFDNIDTTVLDVVKNNLISTERVVKKLRIIENISEVDKITGLNSYEYLFGSARKIIDKYPTSIVSLMRITNLSQIEEKIGKKTSDSVITEVVNYIRGCLSPEYIMAKYSEDVLVIVFSGSDEEGVLKFLETLKESVERIKVKITGSTKESYNGQSIAAKTNVAYTSYYKGTALEIIIKNLNEYLMECNPGESSVTCL